MRLNNIKYPPEPRCSDDLMPEDLPETLDSWEHECDGITIRALQDDNSQMSDLIGEIQQENAEYLKGTLEAKLKAESKKLRAFLECEIDSAKAYIELIPDTVESGNWKSFTLRAIALLDELKKDA